MEKEVQKSHHTNHLESPAGHQGTRSFPPPQFKLAAGSEPGHGELEEETEEISQMKKEGGFMAGTADAPTPPADGNASNGLPATVQAKMEGTLGGDFSNVSIHQNSTKAQAAGALAYTQGNDIHFAPGQFKMDRSGQELLGHELTHVVQQRAGKVQPTTQVGGMPVNDDAGLEKEANDMGKMAASAAVPSQMKAKGTGQAGAAETSQMKMAATGAVAQRADDDTALQRLDTAVGRWNVPEEDVIRICGELTVAEKNIVATTPKYKTQMASALNVGEMVRAVNNLGLPLATKLDWIRAASFITSAINYVEIKGVITAAPPADRLGLKTAAWKSFFVSVCNNVTMVEAVNDLGFDLETKLDWLNAEVMSARLELDYAMIKPWIVAASQPERDALKTPAWRSFFVSVCTNATMVEALNDLRYGLVTKMEWLDAELISVWLELDYATIKPWITAAPQAERDALKTAAWRAFFVKACNDVTIVEAVTDLAFDLRTKLEWMMAEGHPGDNAFVDMIHAGTTAERQALLNDAAFRTQVQSALSGRQATVVMSALMEGSQNWQNPPANDFYTYFVTNGGNGTVPNAATMNCWESVLYAAYLAGQTTAAYIRDYYNRALSGAGDPNVRIWAQLGWNTSLPQYPATTPRSGQWIFYMSAGDTYPGHIALSQGGTVVTTLWSKPNAVYQVQRTQIDHAELAPAGTLIYIGNPVLK